MRQTKHILSKGFFVSLLAVLIAACGTTPQSSTAPTAAPVVATSAPVATAAPEATTASEPTAAATAAAEPTAAATASASDQVATTFTDSAGRTVTLAKTPERLVSLAPSATEILFALGLGSQVLAIDQFSNYPPEAASLPNVGGSRGKYDTEKIVALQPDLILASGITSDEAIKQLTDLGLTVAVVGVGATSFDSIYKDIELVGAMTGHTQQASDVTTAMRQKYEAITSKIARATNKPKVFWELDASDPAKPYSVGSGNFVNDLITFAGGSNVFGDVNDPYPQVSAEQVVAGNPDIIILADAQYGMSAEQVAARPGWEGIAAVTNKQIQPIDADIVSRPGPRIVDGLEATAKLIHPELFQ